MIYEIEPEIQDGQRALPKTQELFAGQPRITGLKDPVTIGWYGTEVSPYRGAFCFVREGAGYGSLVGEFVRITYRRRSVICYCLGETPEIEQTVAVTRRAFLELAIPAYAELLGNAEIIE